MTEKRIMQIYNAIKSTRNMSKYWQDHPEMFVKWYLYHTLGKTRIIYSETGIYSRKDCSFFKIGEICRAEEKKKFPKKETEKPRPKTEINLIRAIKILCAYGLNNHIATLMFKKDIKCQTSVVSSIEKNRELIEYCDCKKSDRERAIDITKLCKIIGANVYKNYYSDIMNCSKETIQVAHRKLFGESKDREVYEEVDVDSRFKGGIAEAMVIERALKKGFVVSKPMIDGCKYDLIIDENGTLKRAQVKYSTCVSKTNNLIKFSLLRKASNGDKLKYNKEDVDLFFLYSPVTGDVYRIENTGNIGIVSIVFKKLSNYSKTSYYAEEIRF